MSLEDYITFRQKVDAVQVGGFRITNTTRDIIIYYSFINFKKESLW